MTIYRGISFLNDNGCYFTESKKVAETYAGWRSNNTAEAVVSMEISPSRIFNANADLAEAQQIASAQGWDVDDVSYFANHYSNKPKSYFVGLILSCWRTSRFAGCEITNEEAENRVKDALKSAGYDCIKQMEKGGAPYPDGSIQLANVKATAWILL